jgi:hypothetical protein
VISGSVMLPLIFINKIKINNMENKQETLEEAAEKYENKDQHQRSKLDFIEGAKWQQERMYSEENMRKAYDQGIDDSFDIGFSDKDDANFNEFIEQFKKQ